MAARKVGDIKLALAERLGRPATLQINRLEDGCVVYHPEQERVHFLNQTAAMVLELCDGHHNFQDIEARVTEHFDLRDSGRNLTGDILQRFIAEGLVRPEKGPPTMATGTH